MCWISKYCWWWCARWPAVRVEATQTISSLLMSVLVYQILALLKKFRLGNKFLIMLEASNAATSRAQRNRTFVRSACLPSLFAVEKPKRFGFFVGRWQKASTFQLKSSFVERSKKWLSRESSWFVKSRNTKEVGFSLQIRSQDRRPLTCSGGSVWLDSFKIQGVSQFIEKIPRVKIRFLAGLDAQPQKRGSTHFERPFRSRESFFQIGHRTFDHKLEMCVNLMCWEKGVPGQFRDQWLLDQAAKRQDRHWCLKSWTLCPPETERNGWYDVNCAKRRPSPDLFHHCTAHSLSQQQSREWNRAPFSISRACVGDEGCRTRHSGSEEWASWSWLQTEGKQEVAAKIEVEPKSPQWPSGATLSRSRYFISVFRKRTRFFANLQRLDLCRSSSKPNGTKTFKFLNRKKKSTAMSTGRPRAQSDAPAMRKVSTESAPTVRKVTESAFGPKALAKRTAYTVESKWSDQSNWHFPSSVSSVLAIRKPRLLKLIATYHLMLSSSGCPPTFLGPSLVSLISKNLCQFLSRTLQTSKVGCSLDIILDIPHSECCNAMDSAAEKENVVFDICFFSGANLCLALQSQVGKLAITVMFKENAGSDIAKKSSTKGKKEETPIRSCYSVG